MAKQAFTFVKKCEGGLSIPLESYDFSAPRRSFFIPYNIETIVVPYVYAVGLFVTDDALNQLKLGLFEVKDYEELLKAAGEYGLVAQEDLPKENKLDRIETLFKRNNTVEIRKILRSKDVLLHSAIVSYAFANRETITGGMLSLIETEAGITLRIENDKPDNKD